jgi:hypothetical protein
LTVIGVTGNEPSHDKVGKIAVRSFESGVDKVIVALLVQASGWSSLIAPIWHERGIE